MFLTTTVNECPLSAGTAEEVAIYRQRMMRRRQETQRPATHAYSFTEIFILDFGTENEITNAATEIDVNIGSTASTAALDPNVTQRFVTVDGKAFTTYMKIILQQNDLIRLLWGKIFESEAKVMLLLGECIDFPCATTVTNAVLSDWGTRNASQIMHDMLQYQQAAQRLQGSLKHPIDSQICEFGDENMRDKCFEPVPHLAHWTVFYMWHFPTQIHDYEIPIAPSASGTSTVSSRSWEMHWMHFCLKMYQRTYDTCTMAWLGSWSRAKGNKINNSDQDTFCGAVTLTTREMLQNQLNLSEDLPYEAGGIKALKEIATGGLEMFHIRFLRADEHSLGSHVPLMARESRGGGCILFGSPRVLTKT